MVIGQLFWIAICNNLWKSSNWLFASRLVFNVGIILFSSVFSDSRLLGLISQKVISLLPVADGKRFSIIVTLGRWSLISSTIILLVIWAVSFDSKNVINQCGCAMSYSGRACYNWE